jgi:hypothetical protein
MNLMCTITERGDWWTMGGALSSEGGEVQGR